MSRRDKVLLGFLLSASIGFALLVSVAALVLWNKSIESERESTAELAKTLAQRVDQIVADARQLLQELDRSSVVPCSPGHLRTLDQLAFVNPYILAIGYWKADQRLCGAGFAHAIQLKPSSADRIYDSGIIAWWPSPQTEVRGVQLFLMRYGNYDIAIDPRVLLPTTSTRGRQVGLWVEGLRMSAVPSNAELPAPGSLAAGLRLDYGEKRLVARYSYNTVFPIDIVVAEPIGVFWDRYLPTIITISLALLLLAILWIYSVLYYVRRRLSLTAELREALSTGGIEAHYQPIIDLSTGRCVGGEALARWMRHDGEVFDADALITLAERAGLAHKVTLTVLETLLRDIGQLLSTEPDLRVNLNLAAQDLDDPKFSQVLNQMMRGAKLHPRSIKLEITERALIDSATARKIVDDFRQRGHEVAIDDFGTGYSSLSYLQTLELDTLKIDKSFVEAIGTEAVTSQVIYHVIELAKGLHLTIVAEGVETTAQASWLRSQGVEFAQGFLFSKPLPAHEFCAFYQKAKKVNVYSMNGIPDYSVAI